MNYRQAERNQVANSVHAYHMYKLLKMIGGTSNTEIENSPGKRVEQGRIAEEYQPGKKDRAANVESVSPAKACLRKRVFPPYEGGHNPHIAKLN